MRPRDTLTDHLEEQLLQVRLAGRDITRACDLARVFHELVRHRRGDQLLEWIREAEQDAPAPIRSFAGFLRQDLDAVTAGLTLTYSSGVVEGHINRLRRSSGRCTAVAPSNSSVPASYCDREVQDIAVVAKGPDGMREDGGQAETNRWTAASPAMLGAAAELLVAAEFALAGYQVYEPLADDRGVDLLVDLGAGRHLLVQVKSARLGERDSYVFMRKKYFPLEAHRAVALVVFPAASDRPEFFLIPATTWLGAQPPLTDYDYEGRKSDPEYGLVLHRRRWREDLAEWSLRAQINVIRHPESRS
ncbi:hypothetical protein [Streptomyces sp. NPDC058268]|uniref:hypothetical protein n=1 Tax=Streptomyces sp. NPDC058268 TaxID=3346413 RepID=UPI0036EB10D8